MSFRQTKKVKHHDHEYCDSVVPVASPEPFIATVNPEGVNISEQEGGQPADCAGVFFRQGERLGLSKFWVHLNLDDLPCSRPKSHLSVKIEISYLYDIYLLSWLLFTLVQWYSVDRWSMPN